MCRDVNGDGTWGGVVLGAVREVAQGLVQGMVEEVVLWVDTNFGIIFSTKASRTPISTRICDILVEYTSKESLLSSKGSGYQL